MIVSHRCECQAFFHLSLCHIFIDEDQKQSNKGVVYGGSSLPKMVSKAEQISHFNAFSADLTYFGELETDGKQKYIFCFRHSIINGPVSLD